MESNENISLSKDCIKDEDIEVYIKKSVRALFIHKLLLSLMYIITLTITFFLLKITTPAPLLEVLATSAIIVGLGSAISTVTGLFESGKIERIKENTRIIYHDIFKTESWKRWSFLSRLGKSRLFTEKRLEMPLCNPRIPIPVGSHIIYIDLPTVRADLFDLPVFKNYIQLKRFRRSAHTYFGETMSTDKYFEFENLEIKISDMFMLYECLYDSWKTAALLRLALYGVHFGVGLVLGGIIWLVFYLI